MTYPRPVSSFASAFTRFVCVRSVFVGASANQRLERERGVHGFWCGTLVVRHTLSIICSVETVFALAEWGKIEMELAVLVW